MVAFEILAEKIGFCEREGLFFLVCTDFCGKTGLCGCENLFFGLHRFFVEKQDSVDVKTFFWFSSIFSGKQDSVDAFDFLVT